MWSRYRRGLAACTPQRLLGLMVAWAAGLAAVQVAVILLSVLHVPIGRALAGGILAAGVFVGVLAATRPSWSTLASPAPPSPGDGLYRSPIPAVIVLLTGGVYLALWVVALRNPDWSWDGNAYHIPAIHQWARTGYVHWIDPAFLHAPEMNGYPKAGEVIDFVLAQAFGTSAVNAGTLLFLPLGVLGAAALASLCGVRGELSLAAGGLFPLVPTNIYQGVSTYVDSSFSACVIALTAAMVFAAGEIATGRPRWRLSLPLGATAGLVLGVKASGIAAVVLAWAILLACSVIWKRVCGRSVRKPVGVVAASVALALAVGGYWYARNWRSTGSPLYPAGLRASGTEVFPGLPVSQAIAERENTPEFMRDWSSIRKIGYCWAQGFPAWPESVFGFDARRGGLGWMWLIGCVPAIVVMLFLLRRPRAARLSLFWDTGGLLAGMLFIVMPMRWWARYTLFLYAVGLPALAVAADRILHGRSRLGRAWLAVVAGAAVLEAGVCLVQLRFDDNAGVFVAAPDGTRRWYPLPGLPGSMYERAATGTDAVGVDHLSGRSIMALGPLCQPIGARDVVPVPIDPAGKDPEEPIRRARAAGLRYLVCDRENAAASGLRDLADRRAIPRQDIGGITVFDLRRPAE